MADEYTKQIERFLKTHDIVDFKFEHLAKHRVVIIPYQGKSHRIVFPASGSDWRGPANTISTIRHELSLFVEKSPQKSRVGRVRHKAFSHRARPASSMSFSESIFPAPDKFYAPLTILMERLKAAKPVAEATAETATSDKPGRVALRTPWLGKKTRFVSI